MTLRSMGFACPSIGSVFRSPTNGNAEESGCPASQRTPSRGRRSLNFLRERGVASLSALRGRSKSDGASAGEAHSAETVADSNAPTPGPRGGITPNNVVAASSASGSSAVATPPPNTSQWSSDGSSPPPTPPPTTPPHPISIPATSPGTPQGVASRPPPSQRLPVRSSPGLFAAPRRPPIHVGPEDEDGYRDMVLPCGLYQDQVIDIMYRDLNPEDFEALCKLDERVPKRNTARWNIVDRLPRVPAGECGVTECGICLAELDANVSLVKLPCGHAFHSGCISRWLTQCKNTCPLCQAPIRLSV